MENNHGHLPEHSTGTSFAKARSALESIIIAIRKSLRLVELKKIMEDLRQSKSGTKNHLIHRVMQQLERDALNRSTMEFNNTLVLINREIQSRGASSPLKLSIDQVAASFLATRGKLKLSEICGVIQFTPANSGNVSNIVRVAQALPKNNVLEKMKCTRCCSLENLCWRTDKFKVVCFKCRSSSIDLFSTIEETLLQHQIADIKRNVRRLVEFDLFPVQLKACLSGRKLVQIYCFRLNSKPEGGLGFPSRLGVRINGDFFNYFNKRCWHNNRVREMPISLPAHNLREGKNCVELLSEESGIFVISIHFISNNTAKECAIAIRNSGKISPEESTRIVVNSFGSSDDDVITTSTALSTICPLGLIRMRIPARGMQCTHLQCFDLETFLRLNQNKQSNAWNCAVCNKFIDPVSELLVDPFMESVLESSTDDTEEVLVLPNGSWQLINAEHSSKKARTGGPIVRRNIHEIVDAIAEESNCTIDLTLSSDDESNNPSEIYN